MQYAKTHSAILMVVIARLVLPQLRQVLVITYESVLKLLAELCRCGRPTKDGTATFYERHVLVRFDLADEGILVLLRDFGFKA